MGYLHAIAVQLGLAVAERIANIAAIFSARGVRLSMETMIQRIRGVMQLLLLWSLVLFWVASIDPVDLHRLTWDLNRNWDRLAIALPKDDELDELHRALNPLWRASLLGATDTGLEVTAERYLRQCDQTLAQAREIAAKKFRDQTKPEAKQVGILIAAIDRQVRSLRWHTGSELGPLVTLADVVRAARPQLSIPGSGQSVPMAMGVAMSIVGLTCVYLYLASWHRTLRQAIGHDDLSQAKEWIFLHPGWLGPTLGFCWLTLPMVSLCAAGSVIFASQAVNSMGQLPLCCVPLLPIAWLWSCLSALRTRHAVVQRLQQLEIEQTATFAPAFDFRPTTKRLTA